MCGMTFVIVFIVINRYEFKNKKHFMMKVNLNYLSYGYFVCSCNTLEKYRPFQEPKLFCLVGI